MTMMIIALAQTADVGKVEAIAQTFGVNWPHLIAQIISFSIVCAILYRLAYRPVLRMLDERRRQIAQGLANTKKINEELAAIEAERQKVISKAQLHANDLIAEAREVAKRVLEREAQHATANAEQIVHRAHEAAAQERARMLAELKHEVGRLVTRTSAAVVGRVLTPDDERRLAEETARQVM
jgi:F-type H+-transporting ATPase subunit b